MSEGVWHKCRLFKYPWVDTRSAKYLGAHTSFIGDYLLKPLDKAHLVKAQETSILFL